MNLLIVNGYDRLGWKRLAKHNIQPICEFYRDQLKKINPKIKSTFIYPSMDLKTTFIPFSLLKKIIQQKLILILFITI